MNPQHITRPASLPFLHSLLWQTSEVVEGLTLLEILSLYERGWRYRDILETPDPEELEFIRQLVAHFHSGVIHDV